MKIPKKIFFIWLGDNIPKYVNYSIEQYANVNKDFEINFIHYTILQIENIYFNNKIQTKYDELLLNSINIILNKSLQYLKFLYRLMLDGLKIFYGKDIRLILVLSDIFRLEILNYYGGIYIDCDTFPIKPFDDYLLSKEFFIVHKHLHINNSTIIIRDNYFIGSNGLKLITHNNEDFAYSLLQTTNKWWCNIKFLILKKKFFEMTLKYGEYSLDKNFYIEHYCDGNWQNKNGRIRTPKCFLDNLYEK